MDETLPARCESEALHLSRAIQPHGALLCDNTDVLGAGMTLEPNALDVVDRRFCEGQGALGAILALRRAALPARDA